jgi:hypothetical protein
VLINQTLPLHAETSFRVCITGALGLYPTSYDNFVQKHQSYIYALQHVCTYKSHLVFGRAVFKHTKLQMALAEALYIRTKPKMGVGDALYKRTRLQKTFGQPMYKRTRLPFCFALLCSFVHAPLLAIIIKLVGA